VTAYAVSDAKRAMSGRLFVLFTRGGVDWLPHNDIETGHKGKSGSEEI
jgi:hypothetical protein